MSDDDDDDDDEVSGVSLSSHWESSRAREVWVYMNDQFCLAAGGGGRVGYSTKLFWIVVVEAFNEFWCSGISVLVEKEFYSSSYKRFDPFNTYIMLVISLNFVPHPALCSSDPMYTCMLFCERIKPAASV